MFVVNDLTISTLKGRVLLKDFSMTLNPDDRIALIGEEGNGKSTLLKILAGIDVSSYVTHTGSIFCDEKTAYLPQKIEDEWLDETVFGYMVRENHYDEIDYEHYSHYAELYDALKAVNLDASILDDERQLRTYSGGEKVRIAMAKLLYGNPDILLLDEPTNDLDLETLIWLESFISSSSLPMIFISHDESLLENCSNGILHLEQLKRKQEARMTFARLNYSDYVRDRLHFIERNNSIAAKQKAEYFKQIDKYRQIYQKVEHQQATISRQDPHGGQLLKKKMHAVKSLGRKLDEKKENLTERFDPEEAINIFFADVDLNPGKVILDYHLDELTVGERVLARNIELQVRGRDKVCLIGKNGSGKTTLLRMMKDVIMSDDSVIAGYMPQNYDEIMDFDISPVEFLKKEGTREEISRIRTHLGSLKFTAEEMEHDVRELSEGQKCKILLLKLILDGCNVLIMDEPTRNLSPLSNPQVRKMLIEYGGCIIAVSHDRKFIENVCDKVYMLDEDGLHSMM